MYNIHIITKSEALPPPNQTPPKRLQRKQPFGFARSEPQILVMMHCSPSLVEVVVNQRPKRKKKNRFWCEWTHCFPNTILFHPFLLGKFAAQETSLAQECSRDGSRFYLWQEIGSDSNGLMIRSWILLGYLQLPSGCIDFNKEDYICAKIGSKLAFSTQPIHLSSPFSPASQSRPRCRELLAKMCWPRCRAAWPNFSMAWPNERKVITVIHGNMDDESTSFENHPSEIEEPNSPRKPAP